MGLGHGDLPRHPPYYLQIAKTQIQYTDKLSTSIKLMLIPGLMFRPVMSCHNACVSSTY